MRAVETIEASPPADHLRLFGVDWETYEALLEAFGRRNVFLSYDQGTLDIMVKSWEHEWWAERIGALIVMLAMELSVEIEAGGSTTFRREDLERGLEPDKCFYVKNQRLIRGKKRIDLTRDPPPDLAVEVDVESSSTGRLPIYAALRVPEVWHFDGERFTVFRLSGKGDYKATKKSTSFPSLPIDDFAVFLQQTRGLGQTALLRSFRKWIRERVPPRNGNGARKP